MFPRTHKIKVRTAAFLISIISVIVYLPILQNGFVNWDDSLFIYENTRIESIDIDFFKWIFTTFHTADWFPLTWISHAIDYAVWGPDPMGHHLTNVLFHGLNTFIVVLLVIRLIHYAGNRHDPLPPAGNSTGDTDTAIIAGAVTGLLFGLHPLHVESVAWASERKDVLFSFFYLLSIMSYLKYASRSGHGPSGSFPAKGEPGSYILCLVFFILSLMSKAMGVTLPLVLLVLDYYPLRRLHFEPSPATSEKRSLITWLASHRRVLMEKLPFFGLSISISILTVIANRAWGAVVPLKTYLLGDRLLVACRALYFYLYKMVWPLELAPIYPYPSEISFFSLQYLWPLVLVTGISAFCILSRKKQKFFSAIWLYYIIILLPVLGIVRSGSQFAADRYTYLSSLGPFLLAGTGAAMIWGKNQFRSASLIWRKIFLILSVAALSFLLATFTLKQQKIWKDSITLWTTEISMFPESSYKAYNNRGKAYAGLGDYTKALEDLNKSIALNPYQDIAFYNRGEVFAESGNNAKALEDYNKAIALNPKLKIAYYNRGRLYEQLGEYNRAVDDFQKVIDLDPRFEKAFYNLGVMYDSYFGNREVALQYYSRAIELNPRYAIAYNNRGIIYALTGKYHKAVEDFTMAIKLNDRDATAFYNRGHAYRMLADRTRADKDFRAAARLGDKRAQQYLDRPAE